MYGRALSIPDDLIYTWLELLTDIPNEELPDFAEKIRNDPRNSKHDLAFTLVSMYHGRKAAEDARGHFEKTVVKKEVPDDIPEFRFDAGESDKLVNIIKKIGFAPSNSEAKRLIQQGGVTLDGETVSDIHAEIQFNGNSELILKVGKRKFGKLIS